MIEQPTWLNEQAGQTKFWDTPIAFWTAAMFVIVGVVIVLMWAHSSEIAFLREKA